MKMFPHRIRLPVLMFIIFGYYQESKCQEPIILPNSRQIVINEGETLNITCISTLIRLYSSNGNLQQSETETFNENWKTVYEYNISLENAFRNDTGWYCCVVYNAINKNNTTIYSYNTEVNWFFVYVKPNKTLIVNEDTTIHLNESGIVKISCEYPSPDINPLLIRGNKFKISETFGINKTSFDLKVTLDLKTKFWEYLVECPIKTDNEMQLPAVNYTWSEKSAPSVIEFYFKENVTFYVQKRSGDNIELGAAVYEDGEKSVLQWIKPNGEKIINSPKYYVRFVHYDDTFVTFALLQIIDANIMDSGNYTLQAQNMYSTAKKNFSLDVIGLGPSGYRK